nr:uncharacterized protein LOC118680551 [Bactrocera oleae]
MDNEGDMIYEGFSENTASPLSFQFQALAIKFAHEKNLRTRRKLLENCKNLLMAFKRTVLINRRRYQQRMQRRQSLLRSSFMQHLLELETNFYELLPISNLSDIQLKINDETQKYT